MTSILLPALGVGLCLILIGVVGLLRHRAQTQINNMPTQTAPPPPPTTPPADDKRSERREALFRGCFVTVVSILILAAIIGGIALLGWFIWWCIQNDKMGILFALGVVASIAFFGWVETSNRKKAKRSYEEQRNILSYTRNIYSLSPTEFEEYVGILFEKQGYTTQQKGGSGDRGVDIRIEKEGAYALVQCKRYEPDRLKKTGRRIGPDIVRELQGAMTREGITKGYIVTTSSFTKGAQQEAHAIVGYEIRLIDGPELARKAQRLGLPGQVMWKQ